MWRLLLLHCAHARCNNEANQTKLKSELILLFAVKIAFHNNSNNKRRRVIIVSKIWLSGGLWARVHSTYVRHSRIEWFLTSNTQSDLIKNRFTSYLCYSMRDDNTLCNHRQKAKKKKTAVNSGWTKNIVQMMTTSTKVSYLSIFIKAVCFNGFVTGFSFSFLFFSRTLFLSLFSFSFQSKLMLHKHLTHSK